MHIKCDKYLLNEAVAGVSKAVTMRSAIPVLEGILLKAEGFTLTLTGYDLEMAITTKIEANVLEPGEIVLSAKLFGDMVRRLVTEEIEIKAEQNNSCLISGGITEYNINGMEATDYPDLPKTDAENTLTMSAGELRRMIDTTIYAVATDDKRPAHTGEKFCITPEYLQIVALDGYRLAITKHFLSANKEIEIIIPQKTLNETIKLIGDDENIVNIAANRRFVVFNTEQYTIISRLIEGEFLDFERVLPKSYTTKVTVETKEFINVLERASLLITERIKNPLRVKFENNTITVRCITSLGKVVDELAAEIEGDTLEIGFNNRYLIDALRNSDSEKVVFTMNGALTPVKITPYDSDEFFYLVLPVRFRSDSPQEENN